MTASFWPTPKPPSLRISRKDLFSPWPKRFPIPKDPGKLIANPYMTWKESELRACPTAKIEVLGPPPTSGTRDAFVEMVMEEGAVLVPE
jgi:phosphate transport system substrate-binding protein